MKVLVTGGTGFIGSHLVRRLVTNGDEVHLIVRPESNLSLIREVKDFVTIHTHDGTTKGMIRIIDEARPVLVFHLASLFLAQHKTEDITALIQSNILFSTQLLEAMTVKGVFLLINTGTSWQHYQNESYNPVCLYAATKQAFEALVKFYVETTALKVITLKLFDTYGPDDPRPKLFTLLRQLAHSGTSLAMSPGEQLIDLVNIDDVIDGYLIAGNHLVKEEAPKMAEYALSSGRPISLKDLVTLYSQIVGKSLSIQWGGRPYRPREVMILWNKGQLLPGWKPKVGLIEGMKKMEDIHD